MSKKLHKLANAGVRSWEIWSHSEKQNTSVFSRHHLSCFLLTKHCDMAYYEKRVLVNYIYCREIQ